jgi:type I restriction enzyme, R subunit
MNEADTCWTLITPKLRAAGWMNEQIRQQVKCTHDRIVPAGRGMARKIQKGVYYLLCCRADYRLAAVEAKGDTKYAVDGLPQARGYAKTLGLQYAFATNGHAIPEFSANSGELKEVDCFPSPEELWQRVDPVPQDASQRILNNSRTPKQRRYYQELAISKALEKILSGEKRALLTLATGRGITTIASQIAWKLWDTRWSNKVLKVRHPKILFLADRNFLVLDPCSKAMVLALRGAPSTTKQFPGRLGAGSPTYARNDRWAKINALPACSSGRLHVKSEDQLHLFTRRSLLRSFWDRSFKGEL